MPYFQEKNQDIWHEDSSGDQVFRALSNFNLDLKFSKTTAVRNFHPASS